MSEHPLRAMLARGKLKSPEGEELCKDFVHCEDPVSGDSYLVGRAITQGSRERQVLIVKGAVRIISSKGNLIDYKQKGPTRAFGRTMYREGEGEISCGAWGEWNTVLTGAGL
jgi:hypothetical protein